MTRLLGIDLGERRIGVAVADADGLGARALTTLRRARTPADDAAAIVGLAAEHGATEVIVGLPLEAAGHEGPQAELTRAWLEAIEPALAGAGLATGLRDERLSSHVAEGRLGRPPRGRAGGPPTAAQRYAWRARIDREAAAVILEDELAARAAAGTVATRPEPAR